MSNRDIYCLKLPIAGWCCKVVLLDCSYGDFKGSQGIGGQSVKALYKKQFNGLLPISLDIKEKTLLVASQCSSSN